MTFQLSIIASDWEQIVCWIVEHNHDSNDNWSLISTETHFLSVYKMFKSFGPLDT